VILKRIRDSLRVSAERPVMAVSLKGGGGVDSSSSGSGEIPGAYRTKGGHSRDAVLDLFLERVSDYRAEVVRAPEGALPESIAGALRRRGARRVVVPRDLPETWLGEVDLEVVEVLRDGEGGRHLSNGQLAACHGAVTGCALAIAETGTIVLDSGPAQGRRALTLLPDYHLCVVLAEQVVETVPEAVRRLEAAVAGSGRPVTLVSGPSATSDIELVRVEGVHGPRNLEVILLEGTA